MPNWSSVMKQKPLVWKSATANNATALIENPIETELFGMFSGTEIQSEILKMSMKAHLCDTKVPENENRQNPVSFPLKFF